MSTMTSLTSLESRDLYTVRWISALSIERAAATAMLDERHEKPLNFAQPHSDKNSYTWGRIGEHNMVIASLPAEVYGTTSAAATALTMLSSFPHIQIGLMVGIGAGIPRPEQGYDIRLGDIVVSQPNGTSGGVVQYDLVKAKENQLENRGFLNMPPQALLKVIANLQAEHELGSSKVPQFLEEMVKRYPNLAKSNPRKPSYIHQGFENDQLFEAAYDHVNGSDCCNCESNRQIKRHERTSMEPEVHYGIIASGNTLVKDVIIRDLLLRLTGEKCICFEMEAAGLMNNFPCLVIRGICDYADSHKNDQWQKYAAATVAAYAKELLGCIPSEDLKMTQKGAYRSADPN
jgi:nucleoside phosphorylase